MKVVNLINTILLATAVILPMEKAMAEEYVENKAFNKLLDDYNEGRAKVESIREAYRRAQAPFYGELKGAARKRAIDENAHLREKLLKDLQAAQLEVDKRYTRQAEPWAEKATALREKLRVQNKEIMAKPASERFQPYSYQTDHSEFKRAAKVFKMNAVPAPFIEVKKGRAGKVGKAGIVGAAVTAGAIGMEAAGSEGAHADELTGDRFQQEEAQHEERSDVDIGVLE